MSASWTWVLPEATSSSEIIRTWWSQGIKKLGTAPQPFLRHPVRGSLCLLNWERGFLAENGAFPNLSHCPQCLMVKGLQGSSGHESKQETGRTDSVQWGEDIPATG